MTTQPKFAALFLTTLFLVGCQCKPPSKQISPPDKFDLRLKTQTQQCYAYGWDSSNFCAGMAAEMADEYIKEHPERIQ